MAEQIPLFVQRWREHRSLYVPSRTTIDPRLYDVAPITSDAEARAFLRRHHYLGGESYPAARFRFGLYRRGELVGVAVFGNPPTPTAAVALGRMFPGASPQELVTWSRLVLLDECEANAESYLGAACLSWLRREAGVVAGITFADPALGHWGCVYQSLSFTYLGLSRPEWVHVWRDGNGSESLPRRAIEKARAQEKGWRGTVRRLVARGAPEPPLAPRAFRLWLDEWVARLTRREKAPPKHRYAFAKTRLARRQLEGFMPATLPYPKLVASAAHLEARTA